MHDICHPKAGRKKDPRRVWWNVTERVELPSVEENLGTASHIVDILHHVTMYALSVFLFYL